MGLFGSHQMKSGGHERLGTIDNQLVKIQVPLKGEALVFDGDEIAVAGKIKNGVFLAEYYKNISKNAEGGRVSNVTLMKYLGYFFLALNLFAIFKILESIPETSFVLIPLVTLFLGLFWLPVLLAVRKYSSAKATVAELLNSAS